MTSGNFSTIPVNSILIEREERQRRELKNIEELAESIREHGLINPIVITKEEYKLVAGERRLTAHKLLGFDQINVQFAEDLNEYQLHIIELEENIRREDLTWQDQTDAIARYHKLKSEEHGGEWSQEKTAEELNINQSTIARNLLVKRAMDEGVEEVIKADKFTTAANFAQRRMERKKTAALRDLRQQSQPASAESETVLTSDDIPAPSRHAEILNKSFLNWSKDVQATPYNLIHCDFPYGVSAGDTKGQSGAKNFGGYEDNPEIYFELLESFCNRLDNFCAPSAHLVFWFSMDYYQETLETLSTAGWSISPFPLVWFKSDNSGILPDANRGPRRIYETALFGRRGDRPIVRATGNAVASGVTKKFHMSEKPTSVLEHFFRMLVDETTVMLDPTCGSGNAVKVAEELGANWATGLEINAEYVEGAKENLGL